MFSSRRSLRPLVLVCATAALAVPSVAHARPAPPEPPVPPIAEQAPAAQSPRAQIVREVRTDGDTTLALIVSGSALLIAAGAAGFAGHDHRRIGRVA